MIHMTHGWLIQHPRQWLHHLLSLVPGMRRQFWHWVTSWIQQAPTNGTKTLPWTNSVRSSWTGTTSRSNTWEFAHREVNRWMTVGCVHVAMLACVLGGMRSAAAANTGRGQSLQSAAYLHCTLYRLYINTQVEPLSQLPVYLKTCRLHAGILACWWQKLIYP